MNKSTRAAFGVLAGMLLAGSGLLHPARAAHVAYEFTAPTSIDEIKGRVPPRPQSSSSPARAATPYIPFGQGYGGEVEPNNTTAQASPIVGTNTVVRANLYPNGDIDFYSFSANAGDRVYAATMTSASAGSSTDSQLTLLASDGTTVIEFDDDNGSFAALSSSIAGATIPTTGTYFLKVNDFTAGTTTERGYELHFRLQSGAPTPEVESNDTPATANPLPANGWVSGTRNPAAATEQDWYSIQLNAGDTVYLSLDLDPERDGVTWNGRLGFGLFGDASNQILVVDDAGTGDVAPNPNVPSEAMFMTVKQAGTYFAFVDSASAAVGGPTATYNLSVSVHPAVDEGVNCTTYTSTDVPKTIGPGTGLTTSTLVVPGNPRIADVDVSIVLNHALMQDVDAHLVSPAGSNVGLFTDIGSAAVGGQTQMDVTFDDEAALPPSFTALKGTQLKPENNATAGTASTSGAYRLSWFDGQNAGGQWTLNLYDDTAGANGGTLTSWSIRVCEAPPPPACPPGFGPTTVYSTDFEAGAAGFTHSGAQDEWELGLPATVATTTANPIAPFNTCNSGVNCWKTDLDNTYDASSNQDLYSPDINLAGLSPPVIVSWAQQHQVETANFDHFFVDMEEVGGGGTTRRLYEWLDPTPIGASAGTGNPQNNIGTAIGWGVQRARVDELAGLNTRLRFHLDSDTTVQFGGVAVDDVSVTACRALSADLAITKTDGVTTVVPGGSATYTITASNAGPDAATGATVADTFPASLTCTWTCVGAGGGTCTASGAGNISGTVNMPAGGSVTYTASCTVSAAASGTLSNTATVASSITDPSPANNSATDTDTLTPQADLAITKTDGVTNATPGGSATYTITASNAGPSNAVGATVADTFPAACASPTWTCVGAGGGTCTASGAGNLSDTVNLPAGGSVTYTASCPISASASGSLSNTATVATPGGVTDPTPANNSATDTDTLNPSTDLSITKTDGVTGATPGGSVTYTITASNAGPSDASAASVADTFPAACVSPTWTCVGAGGASCTASGIGDIADSADLPAGGSVTYTATCPVAASASGSLSNTATVTAPAGATDPTPADNSATDTDTLSATADLSITKTDGVTSATPGGSVTYTITASNAGPSSATGATVADTFPAACASPSWTCAGAGGGSCTASGSGNIADTVNLPAGASVTYTASCAIGASATGSLSNTATVGAPAGVTDPTPGNNSATDIDALGAAADLSITKTDGVTSATPGGSVTYTIIASNAGPSSATGATVADTFPASCASPTWTCAGAGGGTCAASGSGNIADTVNLPAGGSVTYTAACPISASATGSLSNTATVAAPAGTTDPTPGNNSATDTDTLGATADLTISKSDGLVSVLPGASVTYLITASNAGPSNVTGATVADTFPAECTSPTWTCAGAGGGTCAASGSGNIADTVNLPVSASVTYTATCSVSASASGSLSNTATVAAPAGTTDPTPANNSATDTDTLGLAADLSITKSSDAATVQPGNVLTYTIVASNAGPSAVNGATVADAFPAACASVSWTCAATGGATCTASGSGDIGDTTALPVGATATYTAACTVAAATPSGTSISNTATIQPPATVTDPTPANNSATSVASVVALGTGVSATKTVAGSFTPGGAITYTIVIANQGPGAQGDNPGDELVDVLPLQLSLLSASASSGVVTATTATNTVSWNGAIAAGASVTIVIQASILPTAAGESISNQASVHYDADGNGSNEATLLTDDPAVAGAANPTVIAVIPGATEAQPVPVLNWLALLALLFGLGWISARRLGSRSP